MLSQESNNNSIDFTEPQSLATVANLSDLSCNVATMHKKNSTAAPWQSETFEPFDSFVLQEEPVQLKKQQNSLLRSQTSAAKCAVSSVTDDCASKLRDDKVDFSEVQPALKVHRKLIFSAESSESVTMVCEPNILDVSSGGSKTANFNSFIIVGKQNYEESLGANELFDIGAVEHNP